MREFPVDIKQCPNCGAKIPYVSNNQRDCPAGTVINGRYLIGKAIGRGGFGVTYISVDLRKQVLMCIKEYNPRDFSYRDPQNPVLLLPKEDEEAREDFYRYKKSFLDEKKRLFQLRDIPSVVHCFDVMECNNTAYMVMEYLEGRDLKHYVKDERGNRNPLSIEESVYYTIRVLDALAQVHRKGILHRDISPDNVFLLNDGAVKLIDFGSARSLSQNEMTGFIKGVYTAPEVKAQDKEGPYSDLYSIGVVLYFLLAGEKPEPPPPGGILQPPPEKKSRPELSAIFTKAVQRNPQLRYQTAEEMATDLRRFLSVDNVSKPKRKKRSKTGVLVGTLTVVVVGLVVVIVMAASSTPAQPNTTAIRPIVTRTPVPAAETQVPVFEATPTPTVTPTAAPTATPSTTPAMSEMQIGSIYDARSDGYAGPVWVEVEFDGNGKIVDLSVGDALFRETENVGSRVREAAFTRQFIGKQAPLSVDDVDAVSGATVSSNAVVEAINKAYENFCHHGVLLKDGLPTPAPAISVPTPKPTFTPAPTSPPTLIPMPELRVAPAEEYRLFPGDTAEIMLEYGVSGAFDLQFVYDEQNVQVEMKDQNTLCVTPLKPCNTNVRYFNGRENKSFTVRGLMLPEVSMQTEETEHRIFDKSGSGYEVFMPKGDELVLNLRNVKNYGITVEEEGDACCDVQVTGETIRIIGLQQGQATVVFRSTGTNRDRDLFKLDVFVVPHVMTGQVKNEYVLFPGDDLPLNLTFSDGEGINMTQDVRCNSDILKMERTEQMPNQLTLHALTEGVANVEVAGTGFRVYVAQVPSLTGDGLQKTADGNYRLQIPAETKTHLFFSEQDEMVSLSGELYGENMAVGVYDGKLIIEARKQAGESEVHIYGNDKFLYKVIIDVVANETTSEFKEEYVLFEGDELTFPLEYAYDLPIVPDVSSSLPEMVETEISDNGRLMKVYARKEGTAIVRVGSKSFKVVVCANHLHLYEGEEAERNERIYYNEEEGIYKYAISTTDLFENTWSLKGIPEHYGIVLEQTNKDVAKAILTKNKLDIRCLKPGQSQIFVYSDKESGHRKLMQIDLTVIFGHQVTNTFDAEYTLLQGRSLNIPLEFRENQLFEPEIEIDGQCVQVNTKNGTLQINAMKTGTTKVMVDGKSFRVEVLPVAGLTGDNVKKNADGQYTLTLYQGETINIQSDVDNKYSVELKAGEGLKASSNGKQITVTGQKAGVYNCPVIATHSDFESELYQLRVEVMEPVLVTEFESSYLLTAGDHAVIDLEFLGEPTEAVVSWSNQGPIYGSLEKVWQFGAQLHLNTQGAGGEYTVQVEHGGKKQSFRLYVVNEQMLSLYKGNTPLTRNSDGSYSLKMTVGDSLNLKLVSKGQFPVLDCYATAKNVSVNFSNKNITLKANQKTNTSETFTLSVKDDKNVRYITRGKRSLINVRVEVVNLWQLSDTAIETNDDSQEQVILNICQALKELGLLKGDVKLQADRAMEGGMLNANIWKWMQQAKQSNTGFDSTTYYTRNDYLRLIELGEEKAAQKASQNVVKKKEETVQQEKNVFSITQAAAIGNQLYLLDEDGYFVLYDISTGKVVRTEYNSKKPYRLIAGNGEGVLRVADNDAIDSFGNVPDAMMEELSTRETDLKDIVMTDKTVLALLDEQGEFILYDDKKLDPKQEDKTIGNKQAYYYWPGNKDNLAMAVCAGSDKAAAGNIEMIASGDSVAAFVARNNNTTQLFVRSSRSGTQLSNCLGNIHTNGQSNRVFVLVKKNLPDGEALNPQAVAVSDKALAVVQKNGKVYYLGDGKQYQAGNGSMKDAKQFTLVCTSDGTELTGVRDVVLQKNCTLYLKNNGQVWISGTTGNNTHPYAARVNIDGVNQLVYLDDERVLAIDNAGRILLLEEGDPSQGTAFITVQK